MGLNRLRTVICLGAVLLLMAGVAMAGSTTVAGGAVKYARETGTPIVGVPYFTYTLPALNITHVMNVVRTAEEDFFLDVTLGDGARFGATLTSGALSYVPIGSPATGAMSFSIFSGGTINSSSVRFLCDIDTPMTEQGSVVINTTGWRIQDRSGRVGNGLPIAITVQTTDAKDNVAFDQTSADTTNLMTGAYWGVAQGTLIATTATIDVATNRKNFLVVSGDTATADNGASMIIGTGVAPANALTNPAYGTLHRDANPFSLNATSTVVVTVTGDMTGVFSITWGTGGTAYTATVANGKIVGNTATITAPGNALPTTPSFVFTVNGTTALDRRIMRVNASVTYLGMPDVPNMTRDLGVGSALITQWLMNGTVLYTNWTNGNNASLNGRLYVWNPSSVAGAVLAEVFTLPVGFGGSTKLGEMELGILAATSGINLRVAEDILTPLGVALPYQANGGNLVIRLTINAANCTGYSNVFSPVFSYGTVPMQEAGILQ